MTTKKPVPAPAKVMGRPCTVCHHDKYAELDAALLAGEPLPKLSATYGVSTKALSRHRDNHIPTPAQTAAMAERVEAESGRAVDLLDRATNLLKHAEQLLSDSQADGDRRNALLSVRECSRVIETIGKLRGDIDNSVTVNLTAAPILVSLQQVVLQAVADLPEARARIAHALASLDGPRSTLIEGTIEP